MMTYRESENKDCLGFNSQYSFACNGNGIFRQKPPLLWDDNLLFLALHPGSVCGLQTPQVLQYIPIIFYFKIPLFLLISLYVAKKKKKKLDNAWLK